MPPAIPLIPDARDLIHLAPVLVLVAWGFVVLGVDLGLLRGVESSQRGRTLSLVGLVGVLLALVAAFLPELSGRGASGEPMLVLGAVGGGPLVARLDALIVVLLGLVIALAPAEDFTDHWGEAFALLAWSAAGMMLVMAAEELLTLFVSLELMTVCLYLLAAFGRAGARSPEAGLKYFVYGSVSSALLLFGLSLLYGLAGTTRLASIGAVVGGGSGVTTLGLTGNLAGASAVILILAGLGFKLAAAPFHQWAPDVYEGAPTAVAAWLSSASKVAGVVVLLRVLIQALGPLAGAGGPTGPGFVGLLALLAASSMCFGNFAALNQAGLKRMLAYSAIGQSGYLLVGVLAAVVSVDPAAASGAVLFYLATYAVTTVGAFAVAAWLARDLGTDRIDDLDGLGTRFPRLGAAIAALMLSLIGLPPFAGFFGKLFMFWEALNVDPRYRLTFLWLVGLGFFNSVISAFYYTRILRALFLRTAPKPDLPRPAPPAIAGAIVLGAVVALGGGLAARGLIPYAVAVAHSRLLRPEGALPPVPTPIPASAQAEAADPARAQTPRTP